MGEISDAGSGRNGTPHCTKRKYSKKGAELALLSTRIDRELNGSNKRKEQRIYYHRQCQAWHLTSKGKSNGKTIPPVQEKPERETRVDSPQTCNERSENQ